MVDLGDFIEKAQKGSFVKWCTSIIILRIFNINKLSSSMQWCKKKDLSVVYCKGLNLVKNQFVTAKYCIGIVVSEFFRI